MVFHVKLLTFLFLLFLSFSFGFTAPLITSVTLNSNTVGTYEKLEMTMGLTAAYDNPFDPAQVDLKSVFVSPSLSQFTVCGFWNGTQWKLRFAANTTGAWNYTLYLTDSSTTYTATSTGSFTVYNSGRHGWVRVSNDNPRYFEYDDNTPYFGLGHCRPWNIGEQPNIYSDMSSNGMNVLVYWMPSWDNMLPTMWYTTTGYDRYDMWHASNIDNVVNKCEQYNIQLMLTIWDHGELRDANHSWSPTGGSWWQYNPFQLIPCTATTFFTNSTSWQYQQNLYRYIIARWGSSRALGWWQTICEIDGTSAYGNASTWHYKLNDYFQKNDPFRHPTYASKNIDGSNWWPQGFAWMDVVNGHCYYSSGANDSTRVSNAIGYWTRQFWNGYAKPNVISEFGITAWNAQPDHIHNGNWAGVCTGAACGPLDWNDGSSWGDMTPSMFATMKVLRNFISDIPFAQMNLQPATISVNTSNVAVYGMLDTTFCYFWVQDSTPGETITNLPVTVSGLNNGTYRVYWWDTWSGVTILAKNEYVTTGNITMLAPSFKKDIAAKMYRVTDVLSSSTAFWDFNTSIEGWSSGGSYGSATVLSGPIQVETPTHTVTNNGSIYYTFNLTPTGSWSDIKGRATDLGGLNWANYNSITAFIYLPAGAPTLQAKLYTESGTNTTWQEPVASTTISAGTWTALVLSKSDIADPTKVYTFGFKLGDTTNNYTDGTVYFDYVNGYGYSYPSNPMSLSVVGSTSLLIGETTDLTASGGYKPYTWSIITTWTYTGSSPGYLDSYSNPTVTFTATAIGTCYMKVTDAVGQTQNSALLGVSPLPVSVTLYGSPIVSVGKTRQLSAANGYTPYTWAIITTAGSPGFLNAYIGSNITFNATGIGTCYISVIDNYSNTQNSPNINVTVTSAPIVPNIEETITPRSQPLGELFEK